jgi:hypothetical protein
VGGWHVCKSSQYPKTLVPDHPDYDLDDRDELQSELKIQ